VILDPDTATCDRFSTLTQQQITVSPTRLSRIRHSRQ
jgi:hypothetical protein